MLSYIVVVSGLIWAIQATPTGNHTCTGVVKHPVTVRVNVTEPVTYRTYTWCLRMPPRCSKYVIQLKDRIKIHTEMHNRTITVCCKGYVEMNYKCVPACPPNTDCPFMHCNRTNHCFCTPGYAGLYCNDPCPKGFWGADCMRPCDCPSGYTCHHLTGDCMLDDRPPTKAKRTTTTTTTVYTTPQPTKSSTAITSTTETPVATFKTTILTASTAPIMSTSKITLTPKTIHKIIPPLIYSTTLGTPQDIKTSIRSGSTHIEETPLTDFTKYMTENPTSETVTSKSSEATLKPIKWLTHIGIKPPKILTTETPSSISKDIVTTREFTKEPSTSSTTPKEMVNATQFTDKAPPFLNITESEKQIEAKKFITSSMKTPGATSVPLSTSTSQIEKLIIPFQNIPSSNSNQSIELRSSTEISSIKSGVTLNTRKVERNKTTKVETISSGFPDKITSISDISSTLLNTDELPATINPNINFTSTSTVKVDGLSTKGIERNIFNDLSTASTKSDFFTEHSPVTTEFISNVNFSTRTETTYSLFPQFAKTLLPLNNVAANMSRFNKTETLSEEIDFPTTEHSTTPSYQLMFTRRKTKPTTNQVYIKFHKRNNSLSTTKTLVPDIFTTYATTNLENSSKSSVAINTRTRETIRTRNYTRSSTTPALQFPSIKTLLPTLEYERGLSPLEFNTQPPTKPPKPHKEKYHKKHKTKIYEVQVTQSTFPDMSIEENKQTTQTNNVFIEPTESSIQSTTNKPYKSIQKPFPKSAENELNRTATRIPKESNEVSAIFGVSTTKPRQTISLIRSEYSAPVQRQEVTTDFAPPSTDGRPSHTWYSHAREKAKIKEALKAIKSTTPDYSNFFIKPTEIFDISEESNDINSMQTSFMDFVKGSGRNQNDELNMSQLFGKNTYNNASKAIAVAVFHEDSEENNFYPAATIITISCILMLITLVTLLWIRFKRRNNPSNEVVIDPIKAFNSENRAGESSVIYETVYPLTGGPETMEAVTFFSPLFSNNFPERLNRELLELNYDRPKSIHLGDLNVEVRH